MTINYQRWSPDTCGCSFQQEVNSETGEINVLFAYEICEKHKPIAEVQKSKTTLIAKDFVDMKQNVIDAIDKSLSDNRIKNLNDYDNHPKIKQALQSSSELKKEIKTQQHALKLEASILSDRAKIEDSLDKHEQRVIDEVLIGLGNPHSVSCGDVYNEVLEEQRKKNLGK